MGLKLVYVYRAEFAIQKDFVFLLYLYRVRLYNTNTAQYESDGKREITNIDGNGVTVDSAFVTTIDLNDHELHFAVIDECNVAQQANFLFS